MRKKFIDPLIKRKKFLSKNVQFDKNKVPLPSVIEISESGTCNRVCSFCPRSAPDYKDIEIIHPLVPIYFTTLNNGVYAKSSNWIDGEPTIPNEIGLA